MACDPAMVACPPHRFYLWTQQREEMEKQTVDAQRFREHVGVLTPQHSSPAT